MRPPNIFFDVSITTTIRRGNQNKTADSHNSKIVLSLKMSEIGEFTCDNIVVRHVLNAWFNSHKNPKDIKIFMLVIIKPTEFVRSPFLESLIFPKGPKISQKFLLDLINVPFPYTNLSSKCL